jgi:nucleoside-diphosphate-sugar epimerase
MLVCLMSNPINKKTLSLVIGNGYLGSHLAPLLKTELSCGVSRHLKNQSFTPATGEYISLECDIFDEKKLNKLYTILDNTLMDVYFMLPPSTFPSNEPAQALEPLFSLLHSLTVRRIVVVSSSSVYGTQREGLVNPESEVDISTERAARVVQIEQAWVSFFSTVAIVRLAGLYGPNRVVGKANVLAGQVLDGSGESYINLLRIEDAANAIHSVMNLKYLRLLSLFSDGCPVKRRQYYQFIAKQFGGCKPPSFKKSLTGSKGSKRCDPSSSWDAISRKPRYGNYEEGLLDLFAGAQA